jgi:hypothetical protein
MTSAQALDVVTLLFALRKKAGMLTDEEVSFSLGAPLIGQEGEKGLQPQSAQALGVKNAEENDIQMSTVNRTVKGSKHVGVHNILKMNPPIRLTPMSSHSPLTENREGLG